MRIVRRLALAVALLAAAGPALGAGPPRDPAGGGSTPVSRAIGDAARAALEAGADTEAGIDAVLAGLTDAEVRAMLREELALQLAAAAAEPDPPMLLERIEARIGEMLDTIAARAVTWQGEILNIADRLPKVRERLALAAGGVPAMLVAALTVLIAGAAAGLLVMRATAHLRARLAAPARPTGYAGRLARSAALGAVEFAAVVAFVAATRLSAAWLPGPLGPLNDYVWIWHAGISAGWVLILMSRCLLAPTAPPVRVTPLPDAAARTLHRVVRLAAFTGMGGWLVAGLSPTLGFGFPPAILLVALSGTLIGFGLLAVTVRRWRAIQAGVAAMLSAGRPLRAGGQALAQAAPALIAGYVLFAGAYWIGTWLERGQHELFGPAGTLLLLLVLPALDAAGLELGRALTGQGPRAARFGQVIHGAWRTLLAIAAVVTGLHLWGLPVAGLVAGPGADPLLAALAQGALTLILARLAWKLIDASFHREPVMTGHDSEESVPDDMPEATRLSTLVPLLRAVLLIVVGLITAMMLLSSAGVDIGPLLASAGILGLALGFGAQTLVRDIFSGAFFLIDDAFRIGEYIELDETTRGEVEGISIRSLRLRHHRGPVVTIPFGELTKVINHNRDWVIFKMDFRMEPDTDPLMVKKVVKQAAKVLLAHPEHGPKFLEPLKSQGVLMIDEDSAIVIRVKFKCRPRAQFVLRREVYHALQKAFRENGIAFARRKVEVVSTGAEAAAGMDEPLPATRPDD